MDELRENFDQWKRAFKSKGMKVAFMTFRRHTFSAATFVAAHFQCQPLSATTHLKNI